MDENLYLLVNHTHYKIKKVVNQESLDERLVLLFNKKFQKIDITSDDYSENILKIENLFTETYNQRIIQTTIEKLIQQTENEQVLF